MFSKIIKELENTNSRIEKEEILKNAMENNLDDFFEGIKMALDSLWTSGIKKVPESEKSGEGLSWEQFLNLANKLNSRELTGNSARDSVLECMEKSDRDEWNYFYRRILIKDLKCGVSDKTINKVAKNFSKYLVPVFQCQLANDVANNEKKMVGKKQIEVKLDGVRVLAVVDKKGVTMFSRNGKEFQNFKQIASEIENVFNKSEQESFVLDGEVMSSNFQDLMKQVHRKTNVELNDAIFHVFDIIPLDSFKKGKWEVPQEKRSSMVKSWIEENKDDLNHVNYLNWEKLDLDTTEGQTRFIQLNKKAVDGGYEGVMIKDVNAPYECKRSNSWLKSKPFIEVSLTVLEVEEGTGRNENKLGAFVCEGVDDGREIRVNVGSGFTDKEREEFWNFRGNVLGKIVEVRADSVSQNQDGSYSLRFPRFKTFRGFNKGEKI